MMIMEDKKVGELWAFWREFDNAKSDSPDAEVCRLIRKLVEERAHRLSLYIQEREQPVKGTKAAFEITLRDFGIDPETWKETE